MPPRSNDFQRLVTFLESQLATTGATVVPSAMLQPTNGGPAREVDILVEHNVGPHSVRIGIECRDHARRQGVEWIDSIVGRYEHLPVHKVVAVSKSGFTKSAVAAAKHSKIVTITLGEALASDWPGEVARFKVGLATWNLHLQAAEVNYADGPKLAIRPDELRVAPIVDSSGKVLGTFTDDVQYLYSTFAKDDANKWAVENAREVFAEGPGKVWSLRLPYVAHNRYLVPPNGPKRQINEVILCLGTSYLFEPATLKYLRYHDALVGAASLAPAGDDSAYNVALLFGSDGAPRALNVRRQTRRAAKDNAV